jgi:hypothetical protein
VAVTTEPNPCLVPPTGGYRGLDNHLYRVEVHSATNTTAKVKWSRENAHVSTAIVETLAGRTTVRVESLGRDNVLRFKSGDWVEFTSDAREFAGLPGDMRKVTVDDTNKTLTFTPALPIADFPQGVPDATKHLRVIRWDQSGIVRKPDGSQLVNLDLTTDGLIELSAANPSFVLEYGVQATLTVQAGGIRAERRLLVLCGQDCRCRHRAAQFGAAPRSVSSLLPSRDHRSRRRNSRLSDGVSSAHGVDSRLLHGRGASR